MSPQSSIVTHSKIDIVCLYVTLELWRVDCGKPTDLDVGAPLMEMSCQMLIDYLSSKRVFRTVDILGCITRGYLAIL